ncbi:MAG: class I SAM-dependent methyltransferase [Gaiellaceae bacterium]
MPEPPFELAPEIAAYYARGAELGRLDAGPSALELVRTRELLLRHLPPAPARVLDVGGGPGVYADWLAGLGYDVHLVDPVPLHVGEATTRAQGRFSVALGDARRLEEDDESADTVLLLGPLYHLVEREDRVSALGEARRVARAGSVVVAAAISRFAPLFGGLLGGYVADPEFYEIMQGDLRDGRHRGAVDRDAYFTTAYFHHPSELAEEFQDAGLEWTELVGVEGPGWLWPAFWEEGDPRVTALWAARAVESEPSLLGLSAHLLAAGRAPA